MRFEIGKGGVFGILLGLVLLGGVVFAFGLVAGYQMARQIAPESTQVASVYPAPPAPPSMQPQNPAAGQGAPLDSNALAPANIASKASSSKPNQLPPSVAPPPAVEHPAAVAPPPPAAPPAAVAVAPAPAPRVAKAMPPAIERSRPADEGNIDERPDDEEDRAATRPAPDVASATAPTSSTHRKPYNIQIDAVMDHDNASQMAGRLQKLGYHAFLVPTDIGGQTWWRVRVGPYSSEDEASEAEEKLREQYRSVYSR